MQMKEKMRNHLKVKAGAIARRACVNEEGREHSPHSKPGRSQRKQRFLIKLLLFFLMALLSLAVFPHPQKGKVPPARPQDASVSFARGGVYVSHAPLRMCDHPTAVFKAFGLPLEKVPSSEELKKLPHPDAQAAAGPELTYAPQQDTLCTNDWTTLYTRYVQPKPPAKPALTATAFPGSAEPAGGFDSSKWIAGILKGLWTLAAQGWANSLKDAMNWVRSFDVVFHTPEPLTYGNNVVINLYNWVLKVMDGAVIIGLMIGGYCYMLGRYRDFREVASIVIGMAIAANFSLLLIGTVVELHNDLCQGALDAVRTLGLGDLSFPWGSINWVNASFFEGVLFLAELVTGLLLALVSIIRIAMLDLLIVVAPIGLFCFALPQTRAWGNLWAQAFTSTLVVQFFQVLCVSMGGALVGSSGPLNFSIMPELVGIAALLLAFRLPDMLLSHVLRAGLANSGKSISNAIQTAAQFIAMVG